MNDQILIINHNDNSLIQLMEGSIIVIFELMDHEDPLLMSKMDLFILETQTSGVTFTFRDEKLPVMKDSITMDVVYVKKEHVEESWILEGHNLILVIALPVAFFVLFVFIVIVGVCVSIKFYTRFAEYVQILEL